MVDLVVQPARPAVVEPVVAQRTRHERRVLWPLASSSSRERSLRGTLRRLDDDPVLLCDCAEGAPHTCG